MSQLTWKETELEKGTGAFLKKACSLPGRIIPVKNDMACAGDMSFSISGSLFKKLIETECVTPCANGFKVTDLGAAIADK